MSRELDIEVARRMYHMEILHPDWYRYEVLGFYMPDNPLMGYSYDEHSCNAIMYCNGVDRSAGTATPLPSFSGTLEDLQEVLWSIRERGASLDVHYDGAGVRAKMTTDDGRSFEDSSAPDSADDISSAVCKMFVKAYAPID